MLVFLRSLHNKPHIKLRPNLLPGSWIRCEMPSDEEKARMVSYGIDQTILEDALDPHEVPRVEVADGWVYFITRLPDVSDKYNDFTSPVLFALGEEQLATVGRDDLGRLWDPFIERVKEPTTQKTRMFIFMIDAIARQYQSSIATINKDMRTTTSNVHTLSAKDITTITEYERKLNDYLDALYPTSAALQRILSGKLVKLYDADMELAEDVSIDLEQLISRCRSLLRTITNLRDSYRAVMDTRLNETIRLLTVITVALTIPTMIAGIFGMNVKMPAWVEEPVAFWGIIIVCMGLALATGVHFLRQKN